MVGKQELTSQNEISTKDMVKFNVINFNQMQR